MGTGNSIAYIYFADKYRARRFHVTTIESDTLQRACFAGKSRRCLRGVTGLQGPLLMMAMPLLLGVQVLEYVTPSPPHTSVLSAHCTPAQLQKGPLQSIATAGSQGHGGCCEELRGVGLSKYDKQSNSGCSKMFRGVGRRKYDKQSNMLGLSHPPTWGRSNSRAGALGLDTNIGAASRAGGCVGLVVKATHLADSKVAMSASTSIS